MFELLICGVVVSPSGLSCLPSIPAPSASLQRSSRSSALCPWSRRGTGTAPGAPCGRDATPGKPSRSYPAVIDGGGTAEGQRFPSPPAGAALRARRWNTPGLSSRASTRRTSGLRNPNLRQQRALIIYGTATGACSQSTEGVTRTCR